MFIYELISFLYYSLFLISFSVQSNIGKVLFEIDLQNNHINEKNTQCKTKIDGELWIIYFDYITWDY